ncbi:MAG: hypothetical protein WC248_05085 [Candidatus Methanomethylophilaceae archaeon]|jgi:DNA repair exonuclease SbcCD ATPase subunit
MNTGDLRLFASRIDRRLGERAAVEKQLALAEEHEKQALADMELYQKVIILFQKTSEYARRQMKVTIETIVTNALQVVFGGDIFFEIALGTRAGTASAEFFVIEDGLRASPIDAKGGGLVDVIATALRLAVLELYQPRIEGPILLDEPGKMVSAEYAENFAFFIKEYCHKVGRQIIMVTHNTALAAAGDRTFQVSIDNGVSEVVRI